MVKKLIFILIVTTFTTYAREDYKAVDDKVMAYPYYMSLDHLSIRIMNDFESDTDRVRAAFFWIIHNMGYGRSYDVIFQADKHFPYYSEIGRKYQMKQIELEKIEKAFSDRLGVCLDYSLILKELCTRFKIPSEIIIGVAKTDIRDLKGDQLLKNHTWNAVQIGGEWKLVDPTWASGHMNPTLMRFFGNYINHYFFTDPAQLIKSHLPANQAWQLLDTPINAKDFARAPSYFPEYFEKGVVLSSRTNGIISLSEYNEYLLLFDQLPETNTMHFSTSGSRKLKRLGINKEKNQPFVSKIKLDKKLKANYGFLTVYMDYRPILKFKIEN